MVKKVIRLVRASNECVSSGDFFEISKRTDRRCRFPTLAKKSLSVQTAVRSARRLMVFCLQDLVDSVLRCRGSWLSSALLMHQWGFVTQASYRNTAS